MAASISFFLTHWMPRLLKLSQGEGGKGGNPEGAGVALTHRTALVDAVSGLTVSEAEAPQAQGSQHWEGPGVQTLQGCGEFLRELIFTTGKHLLTSFIIRKLQIKQQCDANFFKNSSKQQRSKRLTIPSAGDIVENQALSPTAGGTVNCPSNHILEDNMAVFIHSTNIS